MNRTPGRSHGITQRTGRSHTHMIHEQHDEPEQEGEWLFSSSHWARLVNVNFTDPEPKTLPRAGISDPPEVWEAYDAARQAYEDWEQQRFRNANVPAVVNRKQGDEHTLFLDLSHVDHSVHSWVVQELVDTRAFTPLADLSKAGRLACEGACRRIAAANAGNPDVERMVAAVGDFCSM